MRIGCAYPSTECSPPVSPCNDRFESPSFPASPLSYGAVTLGSPILYLHFDHDRNELTLTQSQTSRPVASGHTLNGPSLLLRFNSKKSQEIERLCKTARRGSLGPQRTGPVGRYFRNAEAEGQEMRSKQDIVREAQEWQVADIERRKAKGISEPSSTTVTGYIKEIQRMRKFSNDPTGCWKYAAQTTSLGTWKRRKAAILHYVRYAIGRALETWNERSPFDPMSSEVVQAVSIMKFWLDVSRQCPTGTPFKPRKRKTKAQGIMRLPIAWQQTLVERMPNYREAVAVAAITGCRPAELERGIEIAITDDTLIVLVRGAKVTERAGQPWRQFAWELPCESRLVTLLAEAAKTSGGSKTVRVSSSLNFSTAIRDAGDRVWPKHRPRLTAYSLRHAAASEFKKAWGDADQVSQALGHCASDTRGSYGRARFSKSGAVPSAVDAARSVRQKGLLGRERRADEQDGQDGYPRY